MKIDRNLIIGPFKDLAERRLVWRCLKDSGEVMFSYTYTYGEEDVQYSFGYDPDGWMNCSSTPNITPKEFLQRVPVNPAPTPMPEVDKEQVIHPQHYGGDTTYEVIKVITAWEVGFCLGNSLKYIARAGKKDPSKEIEDLEKAKNYIEMHLKILKGK